MSTSLDHFSRGIVRAFERRAKEQAKQLAEQQEIQSAKEKLQQQLLILADLKAKIAVFQNTDKSTTTTKSVSTDNAGNTNTLSANEESYKQIIVTKMIELIKQRKMK
jgi:hypothetical protein